MNLIDEIFGNGTSGEVTNWINDIGNIVGLGGVGSGSNNRTTSTNPIILPTQSNNSNSVSENYLIPILLVGAMFLLK